MARYNLPLRIYEQPHRYPKTREEIEANQSPATIPTDHVVSGRNPDEVLRKARAYLETTGRLIRSVSLGPEYVTAVVYGVTEQPDRRTARESERRYR